MSKILHQRAHVILPVALVADIDKLVGKRGRSAFLVELAQREVKLRQQRSALNNLSPAPQTEVSDAYTQIRELRASDLVRQNARLEDLERHRNEK